MVHFAAIKLLLKHLAPVLVEEGAKMGKKVVEKIWTEACNKVQSGEASDHLEALRLVVKEWAQSLKKAPDHGPSIAGV